VGQRKIPVSDFGEKLAWCFQNLVPQRVWPAHSGEEAARATRQMEIGNPSNLWDRMRNDVGERNLPTRGKWLQDVRENRCAPTILQFIASIYPEIDDRMLAECDYDAFRSRAGQLVAIRDQYINLGRKFLDKREALARFAKDFYREIDETPGWPLIAKKEWRLDRPIEIEEASTIDRFEPSATYDPPQPLPGLNARYSQIRRMLAPRSILPFNGDCYRLADIDMNYDGRAIFTYGPCSYFDYYDTCEIHALKMAALGDGDASSITTGVFDLGRKASVPGVNTLTIFLNYKPVGLSPGNYFLLHRRSSKTVQAGNTVHVVPSGQHQPSQAHFGLDDDISIWRTMVREFCEEIYGVPEAHGLRTAAGDQLLSPVFRRIVDPLFRSNASRTFLLGVGLDPVTAKAEILVTTVIDFGKVDISHRDRLRDLNPNWEGDLRYFTLSKSQIRTQLDLDRSYDLKWLPAGKACLTEFIRHYDSIIST
jgi:hypothetical protein